MAEHVPGGPPGAVHLVGGREPAYNGRVELDLRDRLAEYPPIMLEAIADSWRISLTDEQVPDIIERLASELTRGESVHRAVRRLGKAERDALAYISSVGQVRAHVLTRKFGEIRRLGPGRLEWEEAWQSPISPAERLWFMGLICREYGVDGPYHGEVYFVPSEVRLALPPLHVSLPEFRVEAAEPPPVTREAGDAFARDVFAVLCHLRNHSVRGRQGILARHELGRLRPRLTSDRSPRLELLHHLCLCAGLVRRQDGLWRPTSQASGWLRSSAQGRHRLLFHAWLADTDWNELCLMPTVSCDDTGWRCDPVLARKAVVSYLARCAVGVWSTVASLIDSIYQVDADFLRPDGDYEAWYIRDVTTGQYLTGFRSWRQVEGALIRYLLQYPLLWLGIVAMGQLRRGELAVSFRVTDEGADTLQTWEAGSSSDVGHESHAKPALPLVLGSDLSLTASLEGSWYDRFLLERFARWIKEDEHVACYVLDKESVQVALADGITAGQIESFLRRATKGRVPSEVLRALRAWSRAVDGR